MPRKAGKLQAAQDTDRVVVAKPEPPPDLHARLAAAMAEVDAEDTRPQGAFTKSEFQQLFNLSRDQSTRRMTKLIQAGKVNRVGRSGPNVYYMMADE